ncbi:MAG: diguanylate cyclase [Synergistaceae bacterium]|nr:diguanylate cyclase [Synergistaceae bacterium]
MESNEKCIVLIVDDERSSLVILNKLLSRECTVFTAKSGEEALRRAREDPPDLILLDIMMPGMSGFEVLTRLKDCVTTKNIPVIVITGLGDEDDEERGFTLGAVDYITKPFKNAIVIARVRTHIKIVRQMRTIEMLGLIDPLTEISNRRGFYSHIDIDWRKCIRNRSPISFLMIDLDKFKSYNDTYGHPQGDALLRAVAGIFSAAARRPHDLAARLGGEEFGVLLPDTDANGALVIAEIIRAQVEAFRLPTADGSEMTRTTISIGLASTVPQNGESFNNLISRADENMYMAKNTGRNRVCCGEITVRAPGITMID